MVRVGWAERSPTSSRPKVMLEPVDCSVLNPGRVTFLWLEDDLFFGLIIVSQVLVPEGNEAKVSGDFAHKHAMAP